MKMNLEKCPAVLKFVIGLLVLVSGFLIADLPNDKGMLGANSAFACGSAADCGAGQTCSGGICSGGAECTCTAWSKGSCCDGTTCTKGYRKDTRTCTPSNCGFTESLILDSSCTSDNEGKCTGDSECKMENATCSCVSGKCLCCPTVNGVTGAVCEHDTEYCYYDANLQRCDEKGVYCGGNTAYPHFKCEAGTTEPKLKHILKELVPNGSVCTYAQKKDCCTGGICNADAGTCDAHAAAPVISNVKPEVDFKVSSDAEITISAMTNINSICKYSSTDQDYDSMPNAFDNTGKKFHSDELGKMTIGEHTFYVRCKGVNCVKNTTSAIIRFTVVDASGDKLAPKITNPLPSGDVDWENVTLSVETDESATCHIDRNDKVAYEDMETTMGTTDGRHHTATIDLTGYSNGTYTYYVKCKDLSGNTNNDSNQGKIIFDYTNGGDDDDDDDTTPPVISNLEPTDTISDSTPTIKADTDENATCRFSFADKSYDSMNDTFTKTGGQDHEYTFSSSLSDGAYTIYVRCKDDAGNKNTKSEKIEFTIDTGTDDDSTDDDSTDDDSTDDDSTDDDTTDDDSTDDDSTDDDSTDDDDDDIIIDGLTLTLIKPTSDITVDETDFIVATNHEAACRLSDKDQDYASMPWDFSTSDEKTHTVHLIQFDPGDSKVYVRCWDLETSTVMSKSAVFTVTYDAGGDDDDSDDDDTTVDGLTMTLVKPTSAITVDETDFTISTNHSAVCRLSDQDQAYSSMPWQFSTTGGKTHTVHLIQFDPGDSKVYVRCWDMETGKTSSKSAVFTITYNSGGADDDDDDNDTTDDDSTDDDSTDDDSTDDDSTDDDTTDDDSTDDDSTDDDDDTDDDWVDDDFGTDDDSVDDDDTDDDSTDDDSTDDDDDDSDTTSPAISNAKPTDTVTVSPLIVSVETDEVATCRLDLFDKEYDSMKMTFSKTKAKTHSIKVMALADGDYDVYVRCIDNAGNKNTKSEKISFKVSLGGSDKTAPEITNPKPTGTLSSNDIEISVDTEKENATCKFDTQDNDYDAMASDFDESGGTHHVSEFMALGDGNYTIYVRCKDAAGNKNSSSAKIVFEIDSTSDFSDAENGDNGDNGDDDSQDEIVITRGDYVWQNDNAGTLGSFPWVNWYAGYEFVPQKDGTITELCGFFANRAQTISLYDGSFNELAASTVKSWNNWSCSAISPVSVTKNGVYYVVANVTRSSVNFKYQCCDPALLPRVSKEIKVTAGVRQPNNKDFGPSLKRYSYLLFGLVDIKFNSGVGIKSLASDTTPPTITDPQPSGTISNSKPTLSVTTNENATCRFEHAGVKYSSMRHGFSQTGGLTHTKTIGVLPDGNYIRYVRCKDQSGNKNTKSTKIKFTISGGGGGDTTPPVISNAKPTGTIEDNETTISVETNENATCKFCATDSSYTSLCKTFDTTGEKTHSAEVGPLNDEDYVYYVRCKDKAGNVNTKSATIEFTVDAGSNDTTPPSVTNIKVSPTTGEIGDSFTITAKVTDNNDVKSVKAKIQQPDGTTVATLTLYDDGSHSDGSAGDDVYGRKWISTGRAAGKYYVDIVAVDEYDNSTTKDNGATFTLEDGGGDDDDDVKGDCKTITKNGTAADKVDVTFVPCGYGSDLTSFESDAKKHIAKFSVTNDTAKFNFHIVTKTGITCGSSTCENLDAYGSQFRTYASACDTDVVVGLMKSAQDGGCSYMGSNLCFVNQSTSPYVTIHETGHAFFEFDDEYTYQGSCNRTVSGPNCDTSSSCSKWSGVSGTSCIAGCTCSMYYRPASNCIMNQPSEGTIFCPVCQKSIKSTLSSYK